MSIGRLDRELPEAPDPALVYRRRVGFVASLRELWQHRELIRTIGERDFRVRYKQAVLGVAWSVITPLIFMLVFTLVFTRVSRTAHGDAPYPLFAYLGLLPWTFFATSLNLGGMSLVTNVPLLNKVYCPREVFPLGTMAVAAVDTLLACAALLVLMSVYGVTPAVSWLLVPLVVLVQLAFTAGVVMVASAAIVYLRDVRYAVPVFLQIGLFATPVAWSLHAMSEPLQHVYVALNPLGAVIDGYRRIVLDGSAPDWSLLAVSAGTATLVLIGGHRVFKRLEAGFADVA